MRYKHNQVFEENIFYSPDGCWLWIGPTHKNGYPVFKGKFAHRYSYTRYTGEIKDKLFVCHTCDIPLCVNPNHLFLGSQTDNLRDMTLKGRRRCPKGAKCAQSKLTVEQVTRIKGLLVIGLLPKLISKCMNIPKYLVDTIKQRKAWESVPTPKIPGAPDEWKKISGYKYVSHETLVKRRLTMLSEGKISYSKFH